MTKLIPHFAFVCLTSFTATTGLPVIAGGCTSNMEKQAVIQCDEEDTECKAAKAEKIEFNKTVKS